MIHIGLYCDASNNNNLLTNQLLMVPVCALWHVPNYPPGPLIQDGRQQTFEKKWRHGGDDPSNHWIVVKYRTPSPNPKP